MTYQPQRLKQDQALLLISAKIAKTYSRNEENTEWIDLMSFVLLDCISILRGRRYLRFIYVRR